MVLCSEMPGVWKGNTNQNINYKMDIEDFKLVICVIALIAYAALVECGVKKAKSKKLRIYHIIELISILIIYYFRSKN